MVSGPRGDEKERYAYIEDTILLATIIHILEGSGAGGTGMWWTEGGGESGGPQEGNPINPSVAAPRANPPPYRVVRAISADDVIKTRNAF